jgi:hypothetical protein
VSRNPQVEEIPMAGKKSPKANPKSSTKSKSPKPATDEAPAFRHVARKKRSSGKGPTPAEIGASLVALFNSGKAHEVPGLWHHKRIESIESDGTVFEGRKGVAEKDAWWYANFTMHTARAEGPFVGATGFAVVFEMEISPVAGEGAGQRTKVREVGVYTVEKGKIVREEFMAAGG